MNHHPAIALLLGGLVLAGCAGSQTETQVGRLPGDPRAIGICTVESPAPGVTFRQMVFGAPTEATAQAQLDTMGCTSAEIEPYTRERFVELRGTPGTTTVIE